MEKKEVMLETTIRDSGFSALLCCTLGFILLEIWIVRLGARPIGHILTLSIGTALAALAYRAIVPSYMAAALPAGSEVKPDNDKLPSLANLAGAALLVMFGYTGALALANGWMTLFAAFAGSACLFPWSRVGLCRTRILVPASLFVLATVCGMLAADQLPHPLLFPVAVWMLWVAAAGAWLRNIVYRRRKSKASRELAEHRLEEAADVVKGQMPS